MVRLDLKDIQGNVLRGYNFPAAVHLLLRFPNAKAGRAFLDATVGEVTTAEAWKSAPETTTNVALTFAGLQRLEVDDGILAHLPAAFLEPIRDRAPRVLDDTGRSRPDDWEPGIGTGEAHLLITIAASAERRGYDSQATALVARAGALGIDVVHEQRVDALPHQREHFGWADGLGQPAVEGVDVSRDGQGVPLADGRWRDLKAGEFIHGYEDEDGQILSGPAVPLLRNGTFMVYRKLQQFVAVFRDALREEAKHYREVTGSRLDERQAYELMAAKLIGRWRDGVPLTLAPERTELGSLRHISETPENNFRYADDPDGFRCPRGAHIRRTNPRDERGWGGTMATRHRIIRRGMPYGEELPEGAREGDERGLMFICFNADFERQFETVHAQWCNDGNAFGLGNDKDFLLGDKQGSGKVTIEGRPPFFVRARGDLIRTRGCEYLLMPGINALRDLAEPRPGLGRR